MSKEFLSRDLIEYGMRLVATVESVRQQVSLGILASRGKIEFKEYLDAKDDKIRVSVPFGA